MPVTGGFPAQMASDVENATMSNRHHDTTLCPHISPLRLIPTKKSKSSDFLESLVK